MYCSQDGEAIIDFAKKINYTNYLIRFGFEGIVKEEKVG